MEVPADRKEKITFITVQKEIFCVDCTGNRDTFQVTVFNRNQDANTIHSF